MTLSEDCKVIKLNDIDTVVNGKMINIFSDVQLMDKGQLLQSKEKDTVINTFNIPAPSLGLWTEIKPREMTWEEES